MAFELFATRRALALGGLAALLAPSAQAAEPPASPRSVAAMKRRTPQLKKDMEAAGLDLGAPVFLRIVKQSGELQVFVAAADGKFARFRDYPICTFSGELGPKRRVGDGQAPEGFYFVPPGRMNPWSSYHLSFDLGYPNAYDRALGRTGSALMVHGNCVSIGCYAMGDSAIEEIWTLMDSSFRAGQGLVRVHAFPFAMTDSALAAQAKNPNAEFWANLREGWDWFETHKRPPDVKVADGRYVFSAT
jgi:murein L,D-transpeptidase YafK